MFRIGIYTGRTYCGVGDDYKECCIVCAPAEEEATKAMATVRKLMVCAGCTDCEEVKKDEDSRGSD